MRLRTLPTVLAVSILALAAFAWVARADEPVRFLDAIEDLPLMPGLVENAGTETVFDSPQGRIVDAYATGDVQEGAVIAFYAETLPQLGWLYLGGGLFRREGESLTVDFPGGVGAAPPLTVRFHLAPAPR